MLPILKFPKGESWNLDLMDELPCQNGEEEGRKEGGEGRTV